MPIQLLFFSLFAGATVFIGGVLAYLFDQRMPNTPAKQEIIHTLMAFGAGIILSALALVLVPKGLEVLDLSVIVIAFAAGAFLFMWIDKLLASSGGKMATLLAMMMDFVPESIALGAVFAEERGMATLLAIFIGLQNLPEAFNAFRDLTSSGWGAKKVLVIFFVLSFFGLASALVGHFLLRHHDQLTAMLMIFASGGILYLLIQDIIPESRLDDNHITSLGASLGFLVGMVGEKII